MTRKRKRKIRKDRLLLVFMVPVVLIALVITLLMKLFAPSVYYNYSYKEKSSLSQLNSNPYDFTNLTTEPYLYYEDENYYSTLGIDVSSHQEEIDWEKVKDAGVDFAYLRLGYRGYGSGKIMPDSYFERNYKGAKEAGLKVGVYFFSQATNEKEAMEEAFFVLEKLLDKTIDLPIVYDLEEIDYDESRIDDTNREVRTKSAMAFAQKIEENHYPAMIYTNLYWANTHFDLHQIMHYDIWFAQYDNIPEFPYDFKIWQYTDQGEVDGIDFPVDLNIMFHKK